ncbi:hypothetical protein G6F24_015294 [Rhizopus arrhizus]|nr:hypothetical protein G6F24_015294 [Rhizopus arrhizus]
MRAAAQAFTEVTGQAADVGARAAGDAQAQPFRLLLQHLDGVHLHLALGRLDDIGARCRMLPVSGASAACRACALTAGTGRCSSTWPSESSVSVVCTSTISAS